MGGFVEVELDKETVEKFEEIKRFLGVKDDVEALRYVIMWFTGKIVNKTAGNILDVYEREEISIPSFRKSYQLRSYKVQTQEGETEVKSWVYFKIERVRELLNIEVSDSVTDVEIELDQAPIDGYVTPKLSLRFKLADGGSIDIDLWMDSAKKLIDFIKEALDVLENIAINELTPEDL